MSLTLDALKKLQEKGLLRPAAKPAPSTLDEATTQAANAEAASDVEPSPDEESPDEATPNFAPQPTMSLDMLQAEVVSDVEASPDGESLDEATPNFTPQPTMLLDMLQLDETPADTASRQRWTEALANPYGPHGPEKSDQDSVDQPPGGTDAQHASDADSVVGNPLVGESEFEFDAVADGNVDASSPESASKELAPDDHNAAESPADAIIPRPVRSDSAEAKSVATDSDSDSEVLPVESLASNATMQMSELHELLDRETAAVESEAASDAPVAQDDIHAGNQSSDINLPSTPTLPAFLSGLDQPETKFESEEPDEPLIMDTIHFSSNDELPVEPAYNPVIQPLDAFEDDDLDSPIDSFSTSGDKGLVATPDDSVSDADASTESAEGRSDVGELSAAETPAQDNAIHCDSHASGSFRDTLKTVSVPDGSAASGHADDDASQGDEPPQPSPPLDEWDIAYKRDGSNSDAILDPPVEDVSTSRDDFAAAANIAQNSEPDAQSLMAQTPGTLEERISRGQPAAGADASSVEALGEFSTGAAMDAAVSQTVGHGRAASGNDVSMPAAAERTKARFDETAVTTATAYEQTILEELSNSRGERPFLDSIEQIRQLSDYRFPTNLLIASPSPTTRTGDTLARIAFILSQVDEELLLVDASDHASLTQGYELEGRLGFVDALGTDVHPLDIICPTSRPKLRIVPFGVQTVSLALTDPRSRERAETMIQTWERHYHRVLIDIGMATSPLLPLLGPLVGDSVLLVPYGKPNEQALRSASTTMERSGTRPLGCLVADEPIVCRGPVPAA